MIPRKIGISLPRNGAANGAGRAFPSLLREGKSMEVSYGAQADLAFVVLTVRRLRKLLKTLVPEAGVEPA